ncbi:MAG: TIGR00266 family protein [Myxococcales bacterium]|nr:TIGR00266 family protein [Myxococcales bacterium]
MESKIIDRPSFAHIRVDMSAGDRLVAESDAMASMTSNIQLKARFNGGLFRALVRRLFGGESLFVNEYSTDGTGHVILTQPTPGDIECLELRGNTLYLQGGAFIACEAGVKLGVGWAGLASLIGGEGLFRLKVGGHGKVWFGAYGGIFAREVEGEYIVDTGHLVAYEPSVSLRARLSGGLLSSFFSGEGLVTRVRGPGRIYLQTRSIAALAAWTNSHLV